MYTFEITKIKFYIFKNKTTWSFYSSFRFSDTHGPFYIFYSNKILLLPPWAGQIFILCAAPHSYIQAIGGITCS